MMLDLGETEDTIAEKTGFSKKTIRHRLNRVVEGMTDKEQMSTMLEENMQRNDLTIWEQAQGYQRHPASQNWIPRR